MRPTLPLLLLLAVLPAHAARLTWCGVWEWSMPKKTEADLTRIADSAQALGFTAIMMSPPKLLMGFMQDQCHQRDMKLYLSTVFSGGKPEWQQVMTATETARAAQPLPADYMFGGQPVHPDEVFNSKLPCFARPEVRDHFRQIVIANAQLPVDGLAFDMVGYQNYRRCHCPVCEAKVQAYRQAHPDCPARRAEDLTAEEILVSFINEMAAAARQANPEISLTIHIYPWFAPNPYYGHKTDINYVGQTVSWFFRPHWSLDKVQRLTEQLMADELRVYPDHWAAPFLGFDARSQRNYRSATRVGQEIWLIRHADCRGMQMAELGYLLHKPLVAQAVAEELGGTYRADQK